MKIYTKKGDKGKTSLFSGERISKSDLHTEAYGTVDELNAVLGALVASIPGTEKLLKKELRTIQSNLFRIGSWLATTPRSSAVSKLPSLDLLDVSYLESAIDRMAEPLPELTGFILPGGNPTAAWAHLGRTVCRRAERQISRLLTEGSDDYAAPYPRLTAYINRLSDYFFMLARYLNFVSGEGDILWEK
jgi:cob(I)alamin adenosyltransferase